MNLYDEFWRGVRYQEAGFKCPENASEAFQRGYGISYAAGEMNGDMERQVEEYARRNFESDFNRIFTHE